MRVYMLITRIVHHDLYRLLSLVALMRDDEPEQVDGISAKLDIKSHRIEPFVRIQNQNGLVWDLLA